MITPTKWQLEFAESQSHSLVAIVPRQRGKTTAVLLAANDRTLIIEPTISAIRHCLSIFDTLPEIVTIPLIYSFSDYIDLHTLFVDATKDEIHTIIFDEPHLMFPVQDLVKWRQQYPGIVKVIGTEPPKKMYYSLLPIFGWDLIQFGKEDEVA